MHRRYNLAHFILAIVVVLGLTLLMVVVEAQAQIVFASKRDGTFEIYVMDADGGNQRRLTNNSDKDWSPSWSPDGKRIVFCSDRDKDAHFIPGLFTSEIYVMDADGGNQQNLTNDPKDDRSPSWSPDGERIAFTSRRDGDDEIFLMDPDGGNQRRLTNNRHDDYSPSWSPDGKQIVFGARRDGHFENEFGITEEIYVIDANGDNEQRLTENRNNDWDPVWSPDGERIAFASDRKGDLVSFDIYVMDADGGNQQNLSNNRHSDVSPAWLNSPFSVSPAGKIFMRWGWLKRVDQ